MSTNFAPGCFGSALAFRSQDLVCRQCPLNERCGLISEQNMAALRAKYSLKEKKLPPLEEKVKKVVTALRKANLNIRANVVEGKNPFTVAQPALFYATQLMMAVHKAKRPFTVNWLSNMVSKRMESDQSGTVEVICKAFEELGVVRSEGSLYKLESI